MLGVKVTAETGQERSRIGNPSVEGGVGGTWELGGPRTKSCRVVHF